MTDSLRHRLSIPSAFLAVGTLAAVVVLTMAGPAFASGTVTCPPGTGTDVQNALNGGGTVTINGICHGNFIANTNVTIQGGSPGATLNGDGAGTVLTIAASVTVTIRNLTITNGFANQGGGILQNVFTTVNLVSSRVRGNVATSLGGGIVTVPFASLQATNSTISGNTAGFQGGGIAGNQNSVTLTGSTVSGNQAPAGGGIRFQNSTVNIAGSTITNNLATGSNLPERGGGGIWMENSLVTLTNSRVSWNSSADEGGGIAYWGHFAPQTGLTAVASTIDHNTAVASGGGIYSAAFVGDATVSLDRTTVSFNRTTNSDGGGIASYGTCGHTASVLATSSSFGGNIALDGEGGALYNSNGTLPCPPGASTALVTLAKTNVGKVGLTINPNQARYGGGIFNENGDGFSSLSVQAGSAVVHNKASVDGGGIFNCSPASLLIAPSTVLLNSPDNVVDTFCD